MRLTSRSRALTAGLAAVIAASSLASTAYAEGIQPRAGSGKAKPGQRAAPLARGLDLALQRKQDALLPVAQRLVEQADDPGSTIAGVQVDAGENTLHVYSTDTDSVQVAGGLPSGAKLQVHRAAFTRNAMNKAASSVREDAKLLGEQRISVQAVGPTVDGSGVTVSVLASEGDAAADVDRASEALRGRYGDVVAKVVPAERKRTDDDLFFSGWRFNDYSAWFGGDRIATSWGGGCTTGFAGTHGGLPAVYTAAHCGGVGTNFYNGPGAYGALNFMGSMVDSNPNTDVGVIRVTNMTNEINVGSALAATQRYIGSWATPVVGQKLCQSGSYTGEVCDLQVVDTHQYVCRSTFLWWCNGWTGPLADVINSAGSSVPAAGHGDSGAPVYLPTGSQGVAIGLVHGTLTPNANAVYPAYGGHTMWCDSPEGAKQRCSSGFSFAHMPGH